MALSNMRREPRRELTESALGIIVLVGGVWIDYIGASWLKAHDPNTSQPHVALYMVGLILILMVAGFILTGLAYLTHAIGEGVCDWLAARRMDPRPKQRY